MRNLKYSNYDIVFQEVPGETTLVFNITGCTHHCRGCHSEYLWEYFGENLLENLEKIIQNYKGYITCVCFMGGDQNLSELVNALEVCQRYNLKTCLYSGENNLALFDNLLPLLNFLKVGSYDQELGGLDSPKTNQKFFEVCDGKILVDKTQVFNKKR